MQCAANGKPAFYILLCCLSASFYVFMYLVAPVLTNDGVLICFTGLASVPVNLEYPASNIEAADTEGAHGGRGSVPQPHVTDGDISATGTKGHQ